MITSNERQTIEFAREYAKTLRPGDVVLLKGEMGAGKTMFAKGIAEGLDGDGALRLRLPDGRVRRITAGDVFFGAA